MIATSPRPFVWFLPSLINLVPGVRVITPQLLKTVKAWPATRLSAVDKTCNEVTLFKNCGRFFEIFNVQTLLFLKDKEVLKSQPGQPKTKLVSSPIMDNSVVPLYQFWLLDSGKDRTETTSSWLKFWKLNPEKLTLNPRSIRFLGNFITSEFLRFPVYNTRNFHTICFRSFFRKFWRKDIAGEFVLCYRELFFFFVRESGNCLDEGEHERLCKENEASPSTLVILGLTDVREWRQGIKEEISIVLLPDSLLRCDIWRYRD